MQHMYKNHSNQPFLVVSLKNICLLMWIYSRPPFSVITSAASCKIVLGSEVGGGGGGS